MDARGDHHMRLDQRGQRRECRCAGAALRWPSIGFADGTFLASYAQSAMVDTSILTPSRA